MCLAGGGYRHGQVIGASELDGGTIRERAVTPGDLAATIFQHFGVPLDVTYLDNNGRPVYVLANGGQPKSSALSSPSSGARRGAAHGLAPKAIGAPG